MTIQELQQQRDAGAVRARGLMDRASKPMTDSERGFIEQAVNEVRAIDARLTSMRNDGAMLDAIARIPGMTADRSPASPSRLGGGSSFGQQVIDSEAVQFLFKHRGSFSANPWTSPSSEIMATVLDESSASGGDLIVADYRPGIVLGATRRLVMADLIMPGTTNSNAVAYMKEVTFTNAAAAVAEGSPKPESTLVFDAVSDPVIKIPHWLPVTEEMLEDVPTLRSYIDARLRLGVQIAEDDQLLNGSGTAPNMTGLLHRSGLAAAVVRSGSDTNADAILDQICAIELATSLPVDGIVMNPANWKTILKSKDGEGRYYGGGPLGSPQNPVLWGRAIAVTPAIVANTALVGSFRTSSQLFRKGGTRVEASNSHADFFVRNLIAIRAEERLALACYRASAFGTVTSLT